MAKLDVGQGIVRPFEVVFSDFPAFLRTQGLVLAIGLAISIAGDVIFGATAFGADALPDEPAEVVALVLPLLAAGSVLGLLGFVVSVVASGVGVVAARDVMDGRSPGFSDVWRDLSPRLGHLLLLTLVFIGVVIFGVIAVVVGTLLLVLPGILALGALVWLLVSWSLATPAVVLDGLGVGDALARSRALVRENWWRVFAVFLVLGIVFVVATGAVTAPAAILGSKTPLDPETEASTPALVVEDVLGFLVTLVSGPVFATALVVMYRALGREEPAPEAPAPFLPPESPGSPPP